MQNLEERYIEIFGTGSTVVGVKANRKYLTTFQIHEEGLVFHVFEVFLD